MSYFVFRNNTLERFFPKDYTFSGYDDISVIPAEAEGYIWFYQAPIKYCLESLAEEIRGYAGRLNLVLSQIEPSKTIIVFTMEIIYRVSCTEDDFRLVTAVADYNQALYELARRYPNVKVIDIHDFTGQFQESDLMDWKFYFISQMGLNPRLSRSFGQWWARKLESIALKRKKCLVLDLDNTLWGGVLGEDGLDGIKIGGDYPGKAFHFFQEALLELSKAGVILTVCSKNNENDVFEAWEKNPFMVLRKEHFAAFRINWEDKASNIKSLADELNIGLDSMVFVDDNPSERELIRQVLPMVAVPDFPAQPYEIPLFVKSLVEGYFKVYSITEDDRKKVEQYKANAERRRAQESFGDFTSFLESLEIHLLIEPANEFNIPRIAQLTQKTNQFNLTTRRYTDADIRAKLAEGWNIWCLHVSDRFGDSGITGVVLVDGTMIDSFLLSCRVLGKGIEFAFLKKVLSSLRKSGMKQVQAYYEPSLKNRQTADFYEQCGFKLVSDTSDGNKEYVMDLATADLKIEKYYDIKMQ